MGPSIAKSEIDRFYQQMFGRNAAPDDYADKLAALEGGQSLKSQFDFLRPISAHSQYETDLIDIFYKQTFNIDAPVGESLGMDRLLKSNISKIRSHSLFRQGCMLYELIPNMPEHRLAPLAAAVARVVADAAEFNGLFAYAQ